MRQRGGSLWLIVLMLLAAGAAGWLLLCDQGAGGGTDDALAREEAAAAGRAGPTLAGRAGGRAEALVVTDEGDFEIPGRVLDAKGAPVAGVRVSARRLGDAFPEGDSRRWEGRPAEKLERALAGAPPDGSPVHGEAAGEATSATDGAFRLVVHRRGNYRLRAEPAAPKVGTGSDWYLNDRPPTTPLTLRVLDGSGLRGRVVDGADRGVAASLTASGSTDPAGWWTGGPVSTDPATGAFTLPAVPAGKVTLTVSVPGRYRVTTRSIPTPAEQEVLIRLGDSVPLLTGSVRSLAGEAIADARLMVTVEDTSAPLAGTLEMVSVSYLAQTRPDGTYTLEGPVGGRVTAVEAAATGYLYSASAPPLAPWSGLDLAPGKPSVLDLLLFRGGTLSGRILEKGSGAPLAGAEIEVLPTAVDARLTRPPNLSAVSDAQGRYRVDGVPVGRSFLFVRHPTHFSAAFEKVQAQGAGENEGLMMMDGMVMGGAPPPPSLLVFVEREGQLLTRDVELERGLSVSGRVVDGEGRGVEGAEVLAQGGGLGQLQWQWGIQSAERRKPLATSGPEGRFTATGLAPRESWVLSARRAPLVGEPSKPFALSAAEAPSEVLLKLVPGAVLSGRVVDDAGSPVEGATVNAWAQTGGMVMDQQQSTTKSDGAFRLEGLPGGSIGLNAWNGSGANAYTSVGNLQAGEVREGIELKLAKGVEVSGVLVDENGKPARYKSVMVQNTNGGGNSQATSDADGRFTASGLQAGAVRLSAGDWQNQVEIGTATAPTKDLRLTWKEPPQQVIEGTVVDAQGRPVPLCQVSIQSAQTPGQNMMFWGGGDGGLVVNGWFRRQARGKGPWTVSVSNPTDGEGRALNLKGSKATVSDLKAGPITITLEAGLSVSGLVLDPGGRGVEAVSVIAGSVSSVTDAQGAFTLGGLVEGDVKVSVRPPKPFVRPPELTAAAGATDVVVRLKPGLPIAGTVEGSDGRAPSQGWVSVSWKATPNNPAGSQGATLGAGGRFRVEGLPEEALAVVSVQIWNEDGEEQSAPTTVKDVRAGTVDLRVRLTAGVTVEGVVVTSDGRPYTGGGHLLIMPGAEGDDGGNQTWHQLQENGTFKILNLQPGPLRIRLNRNDGGPAGEPFKVDAPALGLRLALPPSNPIKGRLSGVTDPQSFRVWAWTMGKERRSARGTVAADGTFSIEAVAGTEPWMVGARVRGADDRYALAGPVAAGTANVTLEVRTGRSIEGSVVDGDGSMAAGGWVTATGANGWSSNAQVDAQGRFALRGLPTGRYTVTTRTQDGTKSATQADVDDGAHDLRLTLKPSS